MENNGIKTEFYENYYKGRVDARKSGISSFMENNRIVLDNGEKLEADVVIFATGWNQTFSFLEPEL